MVKHKYVVEHKNGSYQVMIWYNGKAEYIGLYTTIKQAIIERDKAMKRLGVVPKYNNIYFDNKIAYYEMMVSQSQGRLTPKLFDMLIKIVKGVSRKFRYKNEDDRYDCESYCYEMIIKNWHNFDIDKYDNVLSYFTEIIKRAFAMQFKQLEKTRVNTISYDVVDSEGRGIKNYI